MKKNKINIILKSIFKDNWDQIFILDARTDRQYTYGEFFRIIIDLKNNLEKLSCKKCDRICILLPNSFEFAALYFASLLAGITVVPIDPLKGEGEIARILSYMDFKLLIHQDEIPLSIRNLMIKSISIGNLLKNNIKIISRSDELNVFDNINYNDLYLITFTSGSTDVPKGVMHSFNNLFKSAVAFKEKFGFSKENIFYHNLPMTYMAGILNLLILPFISESKIVIGDKFSVINVQDIWANAVKYNVNVFWFVPTIIALIMKLDKGTEGVAYGKKKKIIGCVGTAPLNPKIKKSFESKYKVKLYESYGLSETLFVSTNHQNMVQKDGSVGELLQGVKIFFRPDQEILIDVPWMFFGYYNLDKKPYFSNDSFRSGDLGTMDENNLLTIVGRKKDIIKRGGLNINPRAIDQIINEINLFDEYKIMGIEDEIIVEKIVCFCVPKKGVEFANAKKSINLRIIKSIGRDSTIDEFIRLKNLPKLNNGKIDNLKIREMYGIK